MSAFIVGKTHIDYLIDAGLRLSRFGNLRWFKSREIKETDYQKGEVWGPTALETFQEQRRELTKDNADEVGRMLLKENYKSVYHRYDEVPTVQLEEPYQFNRIKGNIDPIQVLKGIDCYEYQSCEHPSWRESEAHNFCESLRSMAIHNLKDYEEAEWEITKE